MHREQALAVEELPRVRRRRLPAEGAHSRAQVLEILVVRLDQHLIRLLHGATKRFCGDGLMLPVDGSMVTV